MIEITRRFTINNGQAPYIVNTNTSAEVVTTFTSENTVLLTLTYETEEDISTLDSVTIIDTNGCLNSFPLSITNICEDFYVSEIMKSGATYSVTSNQDNVIYDWSYNDDIFNAEINDGSIILVQYAGGPQTSPIQVTATNESGCTEERIFFISPCRTFAQNEEIQLAEVNGTYQGQTSLRASSNCSADSSVDWTTLELFDTTGLTVTQINNGPNIRVTSNTLLESRVIRYRVTDSTGVPSNIATVTISSDANYGFAIPNQAIIIPSTDNDIEISLEELDPFIDPSSIVIIPGLTTATAAINGLVLEVDMTGLSTASVGLGGNNINGEGLITGIYTFTRQLADFAPTVNDVFRGCTIQTVDLSVADSDITNITSINGSNVNILNPTTLEFFKYNASETQTVTVTNADNQSASVTFNVCDSCDDADVLVDTCADTINLYAQLDNQIPNGTWTTSNGSPLPATYDGDVSLAALGNYSYIYSTPNIVPESGFDCGNNSTIVVITKVAITNIANDDCTSPTPLGTVSNSISTTKVGNITDNCSTQTSWSGQAGNLTAYTYDQWFDVDSQSSGVGTLQLTITVTGTGTTPLQSPQIQLWSDCSTALVGTLTTSINSATLVYEKPIVGIENFLVQVLSDTTGDFTIQTSQTTF